MYHCHQANHSLCDCLLRHSCKKSHTRSANTCWQNWVQTLATSDRGHLTAVWEDAPSLQTYLAGPTLGYTVPWFLLPKPSPDASQLQLLLPFTGAVASKSGHPCLLPASTAWVQNTGASSLSFLLQHTRPLSRDCSWCATPPLPPAKRRGRKGRGGREGGRRGEEEEEEEEVVMVVVVIFQLRKGREEKEGKHSPGHIYILKPGPFCLVWREEDMRQLTDFTLVQSPCSFLSHTGQQPAHLRYLPESLPISLPQSFLSLMAHPQRVSKTCLNQGKGFAWPPTPSIPCALCTWALQRLVLAAWRPAAGHKRSRLLSGCL